jgi:hypothetical protein
MGVTSAEITNEDIRLTRQLAIVALTGSAFYMLFDLSSGAFSYII